MTWIKVKGQVMNIIYLKECVRSMWVCQAATARRDWLPDHSPSWRCAAVDECARLPVPFSSSISLPFLLSCRPSSPLGVGWSKRGLPSHCWCRVSSPHSCASMTLCPLLITTTSVNTALHVVYTSLMWCVQLVAVRSSSVHVYTCITLGVTWRVLLVPASP